ncbi:MAG: endonuclease/exonuclease/phosphatase family protein, partial [Actinocatenispora sp.]
AGPPAPIGETATAADRPGGHGYLLAGLGVGLCFVLVVLLYQMTYELPLPFDNRVLPVLAAALLGLAGTGVRPGPTPADAEPAPRPGAHEPNAEERDEKRARRGRFAPLAGVPAVLLLVPVLMLVTSPSPAPTGTDGDALRLVTWNLHYGVNNEAAVDPGTISGVLRAQHPDVILLQEVDRGWAIGGGTDLVEWLSRSLAMPYVWSPAADGQFGNVILSSLPISDVRTGQLPYGAGPQHRSYASAKVELTSGQKLRVMTAHLQDHTDNHATRLAEINTLLGHWGHDNPAVIAGDFNAMPGWSEIRRFDRAGLVSAQDAGGHGGMLTSPTDRPRYRPDWIFGTDDVSFRDFARPRSQASDHFPLVVTVDLG